MTPGGCGAVGDVPVLVWGRVYAEQGGSGEDAGSPLLESAFDREDGRVCGEHGEDVGVVASILWGAPEDEVADRDVCVEVGEAAENEVGRETGENEGVDRGVVGECVEDCSGIRSLKAEERRSVEVRQAGVGLLDRTEDERC